LIKHRPQPEPPTTTSENIGSENIGSDWWDNLDRFIPDFMRDRAAFLRGNRN
jgi:hypothetical protein